MICSLSALSGSYLIPNSLAPAAFTVGFRDCKLGDAINIRVTSPTGLVTFREFPIPNDEITTSAGASTTLNVNQQQRIEVYGGVRPYTVVSSDPAKVTANMAIGNSSVFFIDGRAAGLATVTVTDSAGATTVIAVTVN